MLLLIHHHLQNSHHHESSITQLLHKKGSNNRLHHYSKPYEYGLVCIGRRLRSSGSWCFSVFVWYDLIIDAAIIFCYSYLKNILFMLSLHQSKKG